jgi:hypothetical protein
MSNWHPLKVSELGKSAQALCATAAQQTNNAWHASADDKYLMQKLDAKHDCVGDTRVYWETVSPAMVTVLAQQQGNSFVPAQVGGGTVNEFHMGTKSLASILSAMGSANCCMRWTGRVAGFLLMYFGLSLIPGPLVALADFVPFLAGLVAVATSSLCFLVCIPLALTIIAIAWVFYRPKVGVALLIIACVAFVALGGVPLGSLVSGDDDSAADARTAMPGVNPNYVPI